MQPGWILGMWMAAAAAMLGVLVAAATSVSAPLLWPLALLVVLPGAITIGARLSRQLHRSDSAAFPNWEEAAVVEPDADASGQPVLQHRSDDEKERTIPRPIASHDWDVVSKICCALGTQQLDWLRSDDFVSPWLDVHARRVMELEPMVAQVVGLPFAADVGTAVSTFADDLYAFIECYRRNTRTDPLLLGKEWRFFLLDDRVPEDEGSSDGGTLASRPADLQQLAIGLARAYERFIRTASRNPNVRRRIAARK